MYYYKTKGCNKCKSHSNVAFPLPVINGGYYDPTASKQKRKERNKSNPRKHSFNTYAYMPRNNTSKPIVLQYENENKGHLFQKCDEGGPGHDSLPALEGNEENGLGEIPMRKA